MIDNIIQEEEEIFKKNLTVGLTEVSKVIDSAISKRQGDLRKYSFLERKKILQKRENGFTMSSLLFIISYFKISIFDLSQIVEMECS